MSELNSPPLLPFLLNRPEYYTVPCANDLHCMIRGESLLVQNLIVGRTGYGEVKFLGQVDLWGLDLDNTIHFRRKEISVYPDESEKSHSGHGLNRRSEVTLECVYPVGKGTHENITNTQDIINRGFPTKLEKMTAKMGAKFMEYKPETGQWTFMVEHFSQFGLLDDSSSDDDEKSQAKKLKEEQFSEDDKLSEPMDEEYLQSDDDNNSMEQDTKAEISFQPRPMTREYEGYKVGLLGFDGSDEEGEEENDSMFVQGNQFNFSSNMSLTKKGMPAKTTLKMEKLTMHKDSSPCGAKDDILNDEVISCAKKPVDSKVGIVPTILSLLPLSTSIALDRTHIKMDEGLSRHFAYRVGWSGSHSVTVKCDGSGQNKPKMKLLDCMRSISSTGLETHKILCGTVTDYHTDLLEIQREHTTLQIVDGAIIASHNNDAKCLEALLVKLEETQDITVLGSSLHLIRALWADTPNSNEEYTNEQFRKNRVQSWLGNQLRILAQKCTLEYRKLGTCHLPAVIAWLCAGGVQEACQVLCKAGDYQLALLVSQSSTPIIRQLVLKQLYEWRNSGYDALMSPDRLRVYLILSGEQVWESSTRLINVCEGLDWLSSFSLFLRFLPPSTPLDHGVATFQHAFESGEVSGPTVDEDDNLSIFWQLLLLYCNPGYPLSEVLNNQGIADNILDERDAWFIWCTLCSLGLPPTPAPLATKLVLNYTAQLDRLGLWSWSVFVAQHLPSSNGRRETVATIINRNITTLTPEQERVCLQYHQVNGSTFHRARAEYAAHTCNWADVVRCYTACGDYNKAHRAFMDNIGPQKILSRDEWSLVSLITPLEEHHVEIEHWEDEGAIYHSYLTLPSSLPEDKQDLELIRSRISVLGHKLNSLPYDTLAHQCTVNIMGLRTCTLLIEVWHELFGNDDSRELLLTMKTFPLPVEYGLDDVITKLSAGIITEENF